MATSNQALVAQAKADVEKLEQFIDHRLTRRCILIDGLAGKQMASDSD